LKFPKIYLFFLLKIILKTSSSPTSNSTSTTLPQGQILQTSDGQFIILQSAEQHQTQQTQYVQVGGQSRKPPINFNLMIFLFSFF
jgi:hypothetical protein